MLPERGPYHCAQYQMQQGRMPRDVLFRSRLGAVMLCGGNYYVTLPSPSSPEDPRTGPQILKHGLAQLMIHRISMILGA